ncbi:uncharacterized protein I303_105613 [Kwoniella dejecticola CBS 10117]|uniref:Rhodopsin domain-containing protein n=1 Tax=Kwoniella dejecticola CBS 10117 TaxID=1296121 RepID=A0A1A6A202_9TREE|nr:uncharacterized protein I303_04944 [Kwoniella dejecticola CBS 10117]OBR84087.1 hypothetical protein I303_04944 [Kwoniella dejecticola CBS 10117]
MSSTIISSVISAAATASASVDISSVPHVTSQHDRSDTIFAVGIVMTVLATFFVAMRILSKTWVVRKVMWDDYITVVAWLFFVALASAVITGSRSGLGKVGVDIHPDWIGPLRKATYTFTVFYNPATMTIKLAILLLYRRMSEVQPWFRYGTYATMLIVTLAGTVCTFIAIFQCRPISAAWATGTLGDTDADDTDAQCIDVIALFLSSAPVNILTDLAILLLPLPILTSLRMEMRQKVALIATFLVGGFVTVVDIVRIAYLQQALKAERIYGDHGELNANTQFGDFTFYISFSIMWSFIEISVGLMCSCTLVLKPLILRVVPAILRKSRERGLTQAETYHLTRLSNGSPQAEPEKSPKSPMSPRAEQRITPVLPSIVEGSEIAAGGARRESDGTEGDEEGQGDIFDFMAILKEEPPQHHSQIFTKGQGQGQNAGPDGLNVPVDDAARKKRARSRSRTRGGSGSNENNNGNIGTNTVTSVLQRLRPRQFSRSTKESEQPQHTQGPSAKFFDFVNMSGKKPLTELGQKEAIGPILFVSILFFMWGFSYGFIGNLNGEIEGFLGFSPSQSLGLQSSYWVAYVVGPITIGYWILKKLGFKATFVAGLTIYSTGAMAFWPSAVLTSYPGFVISNFLAALGLSVLETAANPFIALAGPGELSEARLLFSQAIQAIGSLASSLLSQQVFFKNVDQYRLFKVQWCYLAVSIFVLILAAIFYYVPLSEATDEDLEIKAERRFEHANIQANCKAFGVPARWFILVGGVFVLSNYVSAQECISFAWNTYVIDLKPSADMQWMRTIGQALFFASRTLASFGCYIGIPPRLILAFCVVGAFLTSLLPMILQNQNPNGALGTIILHFFFEGPVFPLVFAMTIRGQGKHTKSTSMALIASIGGAAVFPAISYKVERDHPNNKLIPLIIVVVLYGSMFFFPITTSLNRNLRRWIDPGWSRKKVGDKIAPDHETPPEQRHVPHYDRRTREDLGITSMNSLNSHTQSGVVGLGLNLNGANLNEVASFGSVRGIRDFDG